MQLNLGRSRPLDSYAIESTIPENAARGQH